MSAPDGAAASTGAPEDVAREAREATLEVAGVAGTVLDELRSWLEGLIELIPNLVVALLVVVLFAIAARVGGRVARRAIRRTSQNEQIAALLATALRIGVLAVGLFVALGVLRLEKTVASLLAGVGVVGIALGFAFQDIAANFMSGIIMALRQPFQNGDLVETHGQLGTVERVTLRATVVRLFSGQLVIIPNKDVLQNPIKNYTQPGERRVEIEVGVSYDDDLEGAADAAREAVLGVEGRDEDRDVEVYFTGFGASSIDLVVHFWLDLAEGAPGFLRARSDAVVAIKRAFDEKGIQIPFPIRTLDLPEDALSAIGGPLERAAS